MQAQSPKFKVVGQTNPKPGTVLPNDLYAERVVLCDLIERPDNVASVRDILRPDDFFSEANRFVYEAIVALDELKSTIDQATICSWLRDRGKIDRVGGIKFFADLLGTTPMSVNVMAHVANVHNLGRRRRMIWTCQVCAAEGYGDIGESAQQWLDSCGTRVMNAAQEGRPDEGVTMAAAVDNALNVFMASDGRKGITGVSTGIRTLDSATAGLQKPELVIITGPTGKGKTALALNIAAIVAGNKQDPERGVVIFSLEMNATQLAMRMASTAARVDLQKYRLGTLKTQD